MYEDTDESDYGYDDKRFEKIPRDRVVLKPYRSNKRLAKNIRFLHRPIKFDRANPLAAITDHLIRDSGIPFPGYTEKHKDHLGSTLLGAVMIRNLFRKYYSEDKQAGIKEFNQKVTEFKTSQNRLQPRVHTSIASIAIHGSDKCYVSGLLKPDGEHTLESEVKEFEQALVPPNAHFENPRSLPPHITFTNTTSYENAQALKGIMEDSGVIIGMPVVMDSLEVRNVSIG